MIDQWIRGRLWLGGVRLVLISLCTVLCSSKHATKKNSRNVPYRYQDVPAWDIQTEKDKNPDQNNENVT